MSANLSLNSAQQQLFDDNQRLISAAVNRFHRRITRYGQGDAADLAQELRTALVRAAQSYQSNRGASFKTFAAGCIDNAARDFIRKLPEPPRKPFVVSGDDVSTDQDNDKSKTRFDKYEEDQALAEECFGLNDDEDGLLHAEQVKELRQLFAKVTLTPFERSSFILANEFDLDFDDIAHVFNLPVEKIRHALDRVKQKIRAARGKTV